MRVQLVSWAALGLALTAGQSVAQAQQTQHPATSNPPKGEAHETKQGDPDGGLLFDAVIVTASPVGMRKFDASYAISNLSAKDIARIAPINTADLLGHAPGVFAEASGGEASNVYRVRGIPDPGPGQAFQEDGIALFGANAGVFFTGDGIIRTDLMTKSFEFVRGGPAAIFASDSTTIYNQVTRQGGETTHAQAQLTLGDTGLYRADGFWSGKIAGKTYLAAGGFYRHHDGYRDNGFPNDKGGQFRVNLRREIGDGEIRFNLKVFNDTNVFYLPIPLKDPRNTAVSLGKYIDVFTGTLNTPYLRDAVFKYADASGAKVAEKRDLSNGRDTRYVNTGFDIDQNLFGFHVDNKFRYTKGKIDFDGLYSSTNPADATTYANGFLASARAAFGADVSRIGYALAGSKGLTAYDPASESGLVVGGNYRSIQNDFEATLNDLKVTRDVDLLGAHKITAGFYYTTYSTDLTWRANDYLLQVRSQPRPLDLVAYNAAGGVLGSVTDNGVLKYASTLYSGFSDINHHAFYLSDTWQVTEQLSLEAGVRQNEYKGKGYYRIAAPVDLGDAATLADNAALGLTGAKLARSFKYDDTAWTVGANFNFNRTIGVYARASRSYQGPGEFNLIIPQNAAPTAADQYEVGLKLDTSKLSVFATAFYTRFDPLAVSVFVTNPTTGALSFAPFTATETNPGVELDVSWRPTSNLSLRSALTYVDAQIGSLVNASGLSPVKAEGNLPTRQPKYYGNLQPAYAFGFGDWKGEAYLDYAFVGKRYVDFANTTELPAYQTLGAGVTLSNQDWSIQLVGQNLTNEVGITEGNPRTDQLTGQGTAEVSYGRPIFGRNFRLVVARRW